MQKRAARPRRGLDKEDPIAEWVDLGIHKSEQMHCPREFSSIIKQTTSPARDHHSWLSVVSNGLVFPNFSKSIWQQTRTQVRGCNKLSMLSLDAKQNGQHAHGEGCKRTHRYCPTKRDQVSPRRRHDPNQYPLKFRHDRALPEYCPRIGLA